ncbi:sulfotransferase family 2 domain-containing protein [Marimonas arenosa]|uniref:Sulfotransferase family 2 domain-containing protein n=1 Tax=Marimonas arenosa TaxID=1795305 RepID=A0AAE3W9X4_9RHOB|nr:sulfotransferase family 2 domain-containing protein [Marimonas arenosa]MDQ2088784.1 sulfotransferase family 2 domain-containing protein [Marimonas arenosa]
MARSQDPIDRRSLDAFGPDKRAFLLDQRDHGTVCFIHVNKCGGSSIEAALGIPKIHDTAQQRIAKIGRPAWDRIWSFATTRHPYARVCSLYQFRLKRNISDIASDGIGLEEWVRRAIGDKEPRFYNIPLMFAPCTAWLTGDHGDILVDAVFDISEIARHWPEIARRAGVTSRLDWHNTTGRYDAGSAATELGLAARRLVDTHFAADFERFGYRPA